MNQINKDKYVIITAGGIGQRMKSTLPKQFLLLKGIPVLCRTLMAFEPWFQQAHFIITLPQEHFETWQKIAQQYDLPEQKLCEGGNTRFHSIQNALKYVPDNAVVLVHDGVRPLVSSDTIRQAFEMSETHGSAIPFVPVTASLRRINNNNHSEVVDRTGMIQIQTPQGFDAKKLKSAYERNYEDKFTDDATVFESAGYKLHFFEDSAQNIKITTPDDLTWAERFIK